MEKTDAEWRAALTPEAYEVLRRKGTERAFTGAYWNAHDDAAYLCAGCGAALFSSDAKFDSGTGWPSFTAPADPKAVATETDSSHGMLRTEVTCRRCGGHLGHVFMGERFTAKNTRHCVNSLSMKFYPEDKTPPPVIKPDRAEK